MPVPLDDMMRAISPDKRADIERNATSLADEYRSQGDRSQTGFVQAPLVKVTVGTKARTGQRCPGSGVWRVESLPSATMPIAVHNLMPAYRNQAVTWELVKPAAA